ncbi:P-loop containing nucleoside triphosphate hydrolase [Pseudocohnilembus persalinus]|uniref:p-loop containing nucleoside triphosphate hydrolase n=2 Tax=Eukaryota TaxID=2759 RepID=A0A0V0QX25_PSEPJ|nr:P-loop containing nucleoside triphosphate hydrolase [Pseudocohnilembus persalinus]|eukprot:KRX06758.1 P-loop containing nucleoside triphosphate hydrolase [Pseudocohnilembus persalinus]
MDIFRKIISGTRNKSANQPQTAQIQGQQINQGIQQGNRGNIFSNFFSRSSQNQQGRQFTNQQNSQPRKNNQYSQQQNQQSQNRGRNFNQGQNFSSQQVQNQQKPWHKKSQSAQQLTANQISYLIQKNNELKNQMDQKEKQDLQLVFQGFKNQQQMAQEQNLLKQKQYFQEAQVRENSNFILDYFPEKKKQLLEKEMIEIQKQQELNESEISINSYQEELDQENSENQQKKDKSKSVKQEQNKVKNSLQLDKKNSQKNQKGILKNLNPSKLIQKQSQKQLVNKQVQKIKDQKQNTEVFKRQQSIRRQILLKKQQFQDLQIKKKKEQEKKQILESEIILPFVDLQNIQVKKKNFENFGTEIYDKNQQPQIIDIVMKTIDERKMEVDQYFESRMCNDLDYENRLLNYRKNQEFQQTNYSNFEVFEIDPISREPIRERVMQNYIRDSNNYKDFKVRTPQALHKMIKILIEEIVDSEYQIDNKFATKINQQGNDVKIDFGLIYQFVCEKFRAFNSDLKRLKSSNEEVKGLKIIIEAQEMMIRYLLLSINDLRKQHTGKFRQNPFEFSLNEMLREISFSLLEGYEWNKLKFRNFKEKYYNQMKKLTPQEIISMYASDTSKSLRFYTKKTAFEEIKVENFYISPNEPELRAYILIINSVVSEPLKNPSLNFVQIIQNIELFFESKSQDQEEQLLLDSQIINQSMDIIKEICSANPIEYFKLLNSNDTNYLLGNAMLLNLNLIREKTLQNLLNRINPHDKLNIQEIQDELYFRIQDKIYLENFLTAFEFDLSEYKREFGNVSYQQIQNNEKLKKKYLNFVIYDKESQNIKLKNVGFEKKRNVRHCQVPDFEPKIQGRGGVEYKRNQLFFSNDIIKKYKNDYKIETPNNLVCKQFLIKGGEFQYLKKEEKYDYQFTKYAFTDYEKLDAIENETIQALKDEQSQKLMEVELKQKKQDQLQNDARKKYQNEIEMEEKKNNKNENEIEEEYISNQIQDENSQSTLQIYNEDQDVKNDVNIYQNQNLDKAIDLIEKVKQKMEIRRQIKKIHLMNLLNLELERIEELKAIDQNDEQFFNNQDLNQIEEETYKEKMESLEEKFENLDYEGGENYVEDFRILKFQNEHDGQILELNLSVQGFLFGEKYCFKKYGKNKVNKGKINNENNQENIDYTDLFGSDMVIFLANDEISKSKLLWEKMISAMKIVSNLQDSKFEGFNLLIFQIKHQFLNGYFSYIDDNFKEKVIDDSEFFSEEKAKNKITYHYNNYKEFYFNDLEIDNYKNKQVVSIKDKKIDIINNKNEQLIVGKQSDQNEDNQNKNDVIIFKKQTSTVQKLYQQQLNQGQDIECENNLDDNFNQQIKKQNEKSQLESHSSVKQFQQVRKSNEIFQTIRFFMTQKDQFMGKYFRKTLYDIEKFDILAKKLSFQGLHNKFWTNTQRFQVYKLQDILNDFKGFLHNIPNIENLKHDLQENKGFYSDFDMFTNTYLDKRKNQTLKSYFYMKNVINEFFNKLMEKFSVIWEHRTFISLQDVILTFKTQNIYLYPDEGLVNDQPQGIYEMDVNIQQIFKDFEKQISIFKNLKIQGKQNQFQDYLGFSKLYQLQNLTDKLLEGFLSKDIEIVLKGAEIFLKKVEEQSLIELEQFEKKLNILDKKKKEIMPSYQKEKQPKNSHKFYNRDDYLLQKQKEREQIEAEKKKKLERQALLQQDMELIEQIQKSGSGKTEATKIILKYLANDPLKKYKQQGKIQLKNEISIEEQVLDSNPLLEAFGNAKTVRNDNSSRFGKFINIYFNKQRLYLKKAKDYNILKNGDLKYEGEDGLNLKYTKNCMDVLGISEKFQDFVFEIISAVLQLGNVTFTKNKDQQQYAQIENKGQVFLENAIKLLQIDKQEIEQFFLKKQIIDPSSQKIILKGQSVEQAQNNRDNLSKFIYSQLFEWIIRSINNQIAQSALKQEKLNKKNKKDKILEIGILDIFGFEIFEHNSFEQLNINYANEKLQQFFNINMFQQEQQLYKEEGIEWDYLQFSDNQKIIEIFEGTPVSVFSFIDDQCKIAQGKDSAILQNINKNLNSEKLFVPNKNMGQNVFGVKHFAGEVVYEVQNFVNKNKDTDQKDFLFLQNSKNEIIKQIFCQEDEEINQQNNEDEIKQDNNDNDNDENFSNYQYMLKQKVKKVQKKGHFTVSYYFREQLKNLIEKLEKSQPYYIRCIKPNDKKLPNEFDSFNVLRQLKCAGLIEAIRIRKAGYSIRREHLQFLKRYKVLSPNINLNGNLKQKCQQFMEKICQIDEFKEHLSLEKKKWQVGEKLVFLQENAKQVMDSQLFIFFEKFVKIIQKNVFQDEQKIQQKQEELIQQLKSKNDVYFSQFKVKFEGLQKQIEHKNDKIKQLEQDSQENRFQLQKQNQKLGDFQQEIQKFQQQIINMNQEKSLNQITIQELEKKIKQKDLELKKTQHSVNEYKYWQEFQEQQGEFKQKLEKQIQQQKEVSQTLINLLKVKNLQVENYKEIFSQKVKNSEIQQLEKGGQKFLEQENILMKKLQNQMNNLQILEQEKSV